MRLTTEQKCQIAQMYVQEGKKVAEIVERLGVSYFQVYYHLKKANLKKDGRLKALEKARARAAELRATGEMQRRISEGRRAAKLRRGVAIEPVIKNLKQIAPKKNFLPKDMVTLTINGNQVCGSLEVLKKIL